MKKKKKKLKKNISKNQRKTKKRIKKISKKLNKFKIKNKSVKKINNRKKQKNISIIVTGKLKPSLKDQIKFKAIEEGTFYTRDLVSEPGNVLHPDEYAKRLNSLKKNGLKMLV